MGMTGLEREAVPVSTSEGAPSASPARIAADSPAANGGRPPLVVAWEVTRACPLACRHCRATAQHRAHPAELTHEEGRAFIADLAAGFPGAVLILTGGEPLTRPDTLALAAAATASGLRVALSVDVGWLLTTETCAAIAKAGVQRVSFSIHFPDGPAQRRFRVDAGVLRRGPHRAREPRGRRGSVSAAHERDALQRLRVAPSVRTRGRPRSCRLGALLPRAHRPGCRSCRRGAAAARAGARAPVAVRPAADGPVPGQADLRSAFSPGRGADGPGAPGAAPGADFDPPYDDVPRLPLRQRVLLRLPRRRRLRLRLPATLGRQRARPRLLGAVPGGPTLPGVPGPGTARRCVRRLRVPRPLRWLPRPRVCGDRRSSGRGAGLRPRAPGLPEATARRRRLPRDAPP